MLCPNCGAEVGEEVSLCHNCNARIEEEAAAELAAERAANPSKFDDEDGEDYSDDERSEARHKPKALVLAGGVGLLVLLVVLAAVMFTSPEQPQSSETGTSPVAVEAATPAEPPTDSNTEAKVDPNAPPQNMIGVLKLDQDLSYYVDQVVLYSPLTSKLEFGFYKQAVTPDERSELTSLPSLGLSDKRPPAVLISLFFERGAQSCDKRGLLAYQVEIGKSSEAVAQFKDDLEGIVALACQFMGGALVKAGFKHSAEVGGKAATWELRANTSINISQAVGKVSYRSADSKARIALWDKSKGTIEVGFFGQELEAEEQIKLRKKRSLTAVRDKQPAVVVTFDIKSGAVDDLDLSMVEKYGVTFYRSEADGIDFAGDTNKVSFYYLLSGAETNDRLSRLVGYFAEGEPLVGRLKHTAEKRMDLARYEFSWDMDFNALLFDLEAEPQAARVDEGDTSYYARASIDSTPVEFKSVVALYYTEGRDVTVGLYIDNLTASEMEQVAKNRAVHTYVNNKRPNLILRLDLKQESETINKDNLLYYEATFLRDTVGSFYFPGPNDRISFQRTAERIRPNEIAVLEGEIVDKSLLKLRIRGKQRSQNIKTLFAWEINIITPLQVLK